MYWYNYLKIVIVEERLIFNNIFRYFLYFVISFTVFIKHLCVYMVVRFMIDKIVTCMD